MTTESTIDASSGLLPLKLLGGAFLLQAIGSAVSGLVLAPVDLLAPSAPDDMVGTMADIAANEWQLRASIFGEIVTACGIVALGILMFTVLQGHGRNMAAIAAGLYLVEASLLAMREVLVFALWWTSDQAATGGQTDALLTQGTMLYESQSFAYSLHTLVFAAGATIFYVLFSRSALLPRPLMVLGLVAAPLALIGQTLITFGVDVPLVVFLPNLPFELGVGLWLVFWSRPAMPRPPSRSPAR